MVREEELVQKAKEVRESLIEMAAREIDATHIEVGQIKAKDDTRKLLTVRVAGANRYVPYQGHDTSEFTVGDYWAIIFDDYGTIRLGWWVANNAGGGTIPFRPHDLLDGAAHPDTVAQAVTRGSVIVGDSTPEWNEVVIGAANRIFLSDGADAGWGQADHGAALVGLLDDDHTIYFLADCTRAFGGDPIPDGADTRSLGSVDAEWLNLYMGVAGKIYFRLDQTVNLYSDVAGTLITDDDFRANSMRIMGAGGHFNALGATAAGTIRYQSSVAGDTDPRFVIYAGGLMGWGDGAGAPDTNLYRLSASVLKTLDAFQCARVFTGDGLVGSCAHSFISDVDTGMYRIGANDLGFATNSTLALELNAVQQALITNGTYLGPGLAFISDPDTGLYRIGANRLGFATAGTFAIEITATQQVGIGCVPSEALEVSGRVSVITSQGWHAPVSEGFAYYVSSHGLVLTGKGSTYDIALISSAGGMALGVLTGTSNIVLGGDGKPDGNKTRDWGLPATAWDDAYADDWHNVADFYFMDERKNRKGKIVPVDDLAIICAMLPLGEFDPRTGLPLLDDNSLPPWVFTRDKKGKKTVYDEDGRPYLSTKMVTSLTWGAIRQLNERIEDLEARLPV